MHIPFASILICVLLGLFGPWSQAAEGSAPEYIGSRVCGQCHQQAFADWQGSHHDLAMGEATEAHVLGDFDDVELTAQGVKTRFYRKGEEYYVRTDGPDGKLHDYRIAYTFGWFPLQQYLIEFPGGRLQSLGLAWDSRARSAGGQRWFHLYPGQPVDHNHALHWTGREQNWNYQCAECHSTNLRKGYDPATDSYNTQWSEIDVACEACHGPGSRHLSWAEKHASGDIQEIVSDKGLLIDLKDRDGGLWVFDPITGKPLRKPARNDRSELELCARCHSRRGQIWPDYEFGGPLLDTHRLALLSDQLYYPDGQIKDEVYVYGSFLQSKMYAAGVTCSDCHEPHSLQLRSGGNLLCTGCHIASDYDTPKHHHHELGTEGASCIACHMPQRNYMVIDLRADHSLRVPRPDLSQELGVPNACNGCHSDRTPVWASNALKSWYPNSAYRGRHFSRLLHAARNGLSSGDGAMLSLLNGHSIPGIVTATAFDELALSPRQEHLPVVNIKLSDKDPLVRAAAVRYLQNADLKTRVDLGWEMLEDPVRTVRLDAALQLAPLMHQRLPDRFRAQLKHRIDEYKRAQMVNSERPESNLNLGLIAVALGQVNDSERFYRKAFELDPEFIPAYVNLADLYRQLDRDGAGEQVLLEGIIHVPSDPSLHYALGLLYIRQERLQEAIGELEKAAKLAPDQGSYAYVHALALEKAGDKERAAGILEKLLLRQPQYIDAAVSLISLQIELGRFEAARAVLSEIRKRFPGDQRVQAIEQRLTAAVRPEQVSPSPTAQ